MSAAYGLLTVQLVKPITIFTPLINYFLSAKFIHLSENVKKLLSHYGFWIMMFLLIRLVGITNPPLETGHNWRQATGLMVARNFLETDPDIRYPRIDDHNGTSGIIGMEFPVLNYLHYLTSVLFGYTHWYGRLINLLVSSIGIFFFGKLVATYFNRRVALAACLVLLSSIWFSFSRKMMSDTFCVSVMFIAIYTAVEYVRSGRFWYLAGYLFLSSIAILSKIPAGIYFALLIPLLIANRFSTRSMLLVAVTIIPLLLTFLWYFVWNPHLAEVYGNWTNSGQPFSTAVHELVSNIEMVLKRFYFNAFAGFIFFAVFVLGLTIAYVRKQRVLIATFASVGLLFLLYMLRSGFYFHHHDYYIIPIVPVMALVAGYAVAQIRKQWAFILVLVIGVVEGIANQQHDFFIKDSERYKMQLEEIADRVSQSDDLIAINGNGNQQQMYLAHRKGWNLSNEDLTNQDVIDDLRDQGCRYIFVDKHNFEPILNLSIAFENDHYVVYEL